jgi:hypothetical protein
MSALSRGVATMSSVELVELINNDAPGAQARLI